MKTFDLEKAKAGAFVCTREGFRARIVCFDADNDRFPIVALLKSDNGKEYPVSFTVFITIEQPKLIRNIRV